MGTDQIEHLPGEWNRGWDEHKRCQLLGMAALPFEAKLEWLEEAQNLGKFMNAQMQTTTPPNPNSVPRGQPLE